MLQYERQQQILEYLEKNHTAKIAELAHKLYISEASVRRDIAALEATGFVERVYGGVILSQYKNEVVPADLRESANSAAKEKIALLAADLIHDGDTVIFDSSSTVRRICKHIKKKKNLKIITNSLRICSELKDTDISVYCTGGDFFKKCDSFLGPYAESFLRTINADSLFFSCKGLSAEGILTDVSETEISMRRTMIQQAAKSYCLCDSSKLGAKFAFTLCNTADITEIICDKELSEFMLT